MKKFEYFTSTGDRYGNIKRDELNKMGLEGWELITHVSLNDHQQKYIFKRELEPKTLNL